MPTTTLTLEGINTLPRTRDEKLNHLTTILASIQDYKSFEMSVWFKHANPEYVECGFAGCALGWAASDPIFRKMGLYIEPPPEQDPRGSGAGRSATIELL